MSNDSMIQMPPHDFTLEHTVLACAMLDNESVHTIKQYLKPSSFYKPRHQVIYRAIVEKVEAGKAVDAWILIEHFESRGELGDIGGPDFLAKLTNGVSSSTNVRFYCERLAEISRKRKMYYLGQRMARSAISEDTSEQIAQSFSEGLREAMGAPVEDDSAKAVAKRLVNYMDSRRKGEVRGLITGCPSIDALLEWEGGMYHVLAAFSGHGKTTCASVIMAGLLRSNQDVLISVHQCEVPDVNQAARIIAAAAAIKASQDGRDSLLHEHHMLRPENLNGDASEAIWNLIIKGTAWFSEQPIILRKPRLLTVEHIEAETYRLCAENPGRRIVVFVDYVQRVGVRGTQGTFDRVTAASNRLAELAKDTGAVVIALAQYTHNEAAAPPLAMPTPAQLRHSREILNDADVILTWHRPYEGGADDDFAILQLGKSRYDHRAHVLCRANFSTKQIEPWDGPNMTVPGLHTKEIVL